MDEVKALLDNEKLHTNLWNFRKHIMIAHAHKIVSLLTKIHYFSPLGLKYTLPKILSPVWAGSVPIMSYPVCSTLLLSLKLQTYTFWEGGTFV